MKHTKHKTQNLFNSDKRDPETNKKFQILVCGPSNISVDNIVERLNDCTHNGIVPVRLGHPSRILPSIYKNCLDSLIETGDDKALINDIRGELNGALESIARKYKGNSNSNSSSGSNSNSKRNNNKSNNKCNSNNNNNTTHKMTRNEKKQEIGILRKELRSREHSSVSNILDSVDVVCCTLTGADSKLLAGRSFDYVLIDEGSQATEASCWIAILKAKRLLMFGDHCQLPPTVLSKQAQKKGFESTLFQRLLCMYGDGVSRMLKVQYRMNKDIVAWSNSELYHNELER